MDVMRQHVGLQQHFAPIYEGNGDLEMLAGLYLCHLTSQSLSQMFFSFQWPDLRKLCLPSGLLTVPATAFYDTLFVFLMMWFMCFILKYTCYLFYAIFLSSYLFILLIMYSKLFRLTYLRWRQEAQSTNAPICMAVLMGLVAQRLIRTW